MVLVVESDFSRQKCVDSRCVLRMRLKGMGVTLCNMSDKVSGDWWRENMKERKEKVEECEGNYVCGME